MFKAAIPQGTFLFLAFFLLMCFPASAQTARVQGTVVEAGSGEPLPGVNIFLEGTTRGTASGANGTFAIKKLPAGTHTLIASIIGFETARQSITLSTADTLKVTFALKEVFIEVSEIVVERVSMTGGHQGIDGIPGSATYIGPRTLEKFNHTDIHRILQQVPGINLQDEEGYGLRPNIGLRGTGSERSAKITVMEDGVLAAPAPYAAPSAYYFPTAGRMQAVEVRKGSSQVKYGPYTTGGALNLISTQIPTAFSGRFNVLLGEHQERTIDAHAGSATKNFGFLAQTFQARADGFKQLDTGGNTGFDKKDYLAKLRVNTNPDVAVYQALTFKISQMLERSDETYLGLTDADFGLTPTRRYAGSAEDVINTEQRQYIFRHLIQPARNVDVTTTLYRTEFARNWYKLDRVRASEDGDRVRIADLLEDPATYADEYAIITGSSSPNDNALELKANNRSYYARGVQTVVGLRFGTEAMKHDVEFGLRLHEDQIDRFQWVDAYRMSSGIMQLTRSGTPGTESNRLETATALATYGQYRLERGAWTVIPGLRYEHIRIERDDYGKEDPDRTGINLASRENTVDVVIPGIGVSYRFTQALQTFAGIHKGFAPPGSKEGTRPEESINYELGLRYNARGLQTEGVVFFNDYSNLLGLDLAASGGEGTTDQFNGGAVDVVGLEFSMGYNLGLLLGGRLSLPFSASYTYTRGTFQNTFVSEYAPWGTVEVDDELPYLPEHQFTANLGLDVSRFAMNLSAKYVSPMRTEAGQGSLEPSRQTDAYLFMDLSAEFTVTQNVRLFSSVRNLTDAVFIVARRPAGVRPSLPRTFALGIKTKF